jgi:hypothetical protein
LEPWWKDNKLSQSAEKRPGKETQGIPLRPPSSGRERRTICFAVVDPLPQFAAEAEGCGSAKDRQGAGDLFSIGPSRVAVLRFCIQSYDFISGANELARTQT